MTSEQRAALVRELNAAGLTDRDIAKDARCDVGEHAVGNLRRALGLPRNRNNAEHRQKLRVATQAARERGVRCGSPNSGAYRLRSTAFTDGWPLDLQVRHTRLLDALWNLGPMTLKQLAHAAGVAYRGSDTFKSDDPERTALRHLIARRLVVRILPSVAGTGTDQVFSIPLWFERSA